MTASARKLFEQYNQGLIACLPIKNIAFLEALKGKNILSDNVRNSLEQFSNASERSSYFLENVIKEGFDRGDDSYFTNLLAAMKESSYDNVKDLALEIQNRLDIKDQVETVTTDNSLNIIPNRKINDKPDLPSLLDRIVHERYAIHWEKLGLKLGLADHHIDTISHNNKHNPNRVEDCCTAMLKQWLKEVPLPTWGKLNDAIKEIEASNFIPETGGDAISKLSKRVTQLNLAKQYTIDEETWPPYQLKTFVPLLLMHYKGQHNLKQSNVVTGLAAKRKIDDLPSMAQLIPTQCHKQDDSHESLKEVFDTSTLTKRIAEILSPLEYGYPSCFVLIEGPPGIGKSVLLKEISYRWANKQLLQAYKLVLLICLRDPMVQQAESIDDLLHLYCKGDKRASEIVSASCDQLLDNGGKGLTLLLDGFDELPERLQNNSLIADIIKRRVLPHCGLVLSSRSHASKKFHNKATLIVEILGFTEEDRKMCIEQAFQETPEKIKKLSQYLDEHPNIHSLCFVPFNMVVLLFLCEQGIPLPKNSTDMYNHFICLTICCYLVTSGYHLTNTITDLTNLPDPCNKIIEQLSTLSLQALKKYNLVFTLDEIKAVCPHIEDIPGAINGFGLLQVVQHIGLTGKTLTFNFIHFSIQEYLAAYCITKLSPPEELQILKDKFWHVNYLNTFTIYVALTKGQRPSFKQFLSSGSKTINISEKFLNDVDFCFHLYRCFYEAGDEKMCESIAKARIFSNHIIYSVASLPTQMECLTLFLTTTFHHFWTRLGFGYSQDYGCSILHRGLKDWSITITELWLGRSGLTSSSSKLVSDIVINCRVEVLILDYNETIGENEQLYSMLSHPSTLRVLSMYKTGVANLLFTVLEQNNTLKILSIEGNNISDDSCPLIANAIKLNRCLEKLWIRYNPISGEAISPILQSLQFNNTLETLLLPNYPDDVKRYIKSMEEKITKTRESHGSCTQLHIDCNAVTHALYSLTQ